MVIVLAILYKHVMNKFHCGSYTFPFAGMVTIYRPVSIINAGREICMGFPLIYFAAFSHSTIIRGHMEWHFCFSLHEFCFSIAAFFTMLRPTQS